MIGGRLYPGRAPLYHGPKKRRKGEKRKLMETIWIVGVGHFGLRAFNKLSIQQKERQFVLIDPNTTDIEPSVRVSYRFEQADGVNFLENKLRRDLGPDWIIPAVPIHLAAEWCLRHLAPRGFSRETALGPILNPMLPNPMAGIDGDIYVSHAEFQCPDNCPEPRERCTVTQEVRKKDMFALLEQIRVPMFQSMVIRSHQLAPGVGGYRTAQLFSLLHQAESAENGVLISTACRCHGVITGLKK